MKLTRAKYQQGGLTRVARKAGPDVWVLSWREDSPTGRKQCKTVVGTVDKYKSRAAAQKAVETLRININNESWMPSTLEELVSHYREKELPSKTPYTREVYEGNFKTWILPVWGSYTLQGVRTIKIEEWLRSLSLSNGSKAKIRNIMSSLWAHAIRHEWIGNNPITHVRQSAKRERTPEFLTVEEINALLTELSEPYRTMVFVAVATGLRVSELMALQWRDFVFEAGEINLSRGIVRQNVGQMKTEASRKPLPLVPALAAVLMNWRALCPYNQPSDWVFASPTKRGTQPYWHSAVMEDHVRPAGKRAGITKRIGWHTFRHSYGTLLKHYGADVKVVQELLRHSTSKVSLDVYTQAMTPAKREAQSSITSLLLPCATSALTTYPVSD
jgi:integrase